MGVKRRPWWSALRISVGGMMLAILVVGAWLGLMVESAQIQREAVAAIRSKNGRVYYEWDDVAGKHVPFGKPWWPQWVVDRVGVDLLGNIVNAYLGPEGTDAELVRALQLDGLEYLDISKARVTDAGLEGLGRLSGLKRLDIHNTRITDAGLA
jgi:hypothetical protein